MKLKIKLCNSKSFHFFILTLLCALVSQTINAQSSSGKADAKETIEIPAHLRGNPAALRSYLRKQNHEQINESFLPRGTSQTLIAPNVGGIDPTFSGSLTEGRATVNGTAVQADGKILIGGFFSTVNGTRRSGLERLNTDGTRDTAFNAGGSGANGTVYIIIPLTDGKIIISGSFTTYNGVARGSIARLNADGTLDTSFNIPTGANGSIQDMIFQTDGKILISGSFTAFDGTVRNRVARLNADGTLDTAFNPNVDGFVEELALQPDGKILIGGIFSNVGGTPRNAVARLNADGTVDTTFNPGEGPLLNGFFGNVYALQVLSDGRILIGGEFDTYGSTLRRNIACINPNGSLNGAFNLFFPGSGVEYFGVQSDGKILIAGDLSDTSPGISLARLNADGSDDTSFTGTILDDLGYALALQTDGKIILTGFFRDALKRFNANGTLDSGFNASAKLEATVRAVKVQPDGKLLVGGDFRFAGGIARRNIARFNVNGTVDTTFDPGAGADNQVYSIGVQSNGKILLGGLFQNYNETPRNFIVSLESNGNIDGSFDFSNSASIVYDIETQPDGKILLGGLFFNNTGQANTGIVRILSNGVFDMSFNNTNATNGFVLDIENLPSGKILIGGNFTLAGAATRNRVARLNADGTLDTAFVPGGTNGTVWEVAPLPNGQVYVGGNFTLFGGNSAFQKIVRLDSSGAIDVSFASGSGFNGSVYAIYPQMDGKVLVGGQFSAYNGTAVNHLAQLNTNGTLDTSYSAAIPNDVFFLVWRIVAQTDGKILVGGRFNSFGGQMRNSLVRLSPVIRTTKFDYDGDGKADVSVFRPANGTWYLNRSTAGFAEIAFGVSTDKIVPADYDGDGKTDTAIFRDGIWYYLRSSDGGFVTISFGQAGDIPVAADYDGDGKADQAVYRSGTWYLNRSTQGYAAIQFGVSTDKPTAADYDGDGKTDLAVFRNGVWYYLRSSDGGLVAVFFGTANDVPAAADYDGDGKADQAVFRNGTWYLNQSTAGFAAVSFGTVNDTPVVADYDGDGRADVAVFRDGNWYLQQTTNGFAAQFFGQTGDKPTPSAYLP